MEKRGTNITPLLEQILGVAQIRGKEGIKALSKALREMGDEPMLKPENLAKLMENIKNQKRDG